MHEALGSQITLSAVIVFALQCLKNSKLAPFITAESDKLNRLLALALSGAAAIGIHFTYDASLAGGTITIIGIGWASVTHGGWDWLQSFAVQEWLYRSSVKSLPAKV